MRHARGRFRTQPNPNVTAMPRRDDHLQPRFDDAAVERLRSTTGTRGTRVRMTREEFVAKLRAQRRLRFYRPPAH